MSPAARKPPAETRVLPLFPTFVWYAQLDPEVAAAINRSIGDRLEKMLAAKGLAGREYLQTQQQLHRDPAFAELLPEIDAAARGALDFLKVRYTRFQITGCWANLSEPGAVHDPHCHPNNYLSGVYYVAAAPGGDSITFHDPRPQPNIFMPPTRELSNENAGKINVGIKPGTLLVFPSWFVHSVRPNRSGTRRISVSFNLMFDNFAEEMSPPLWEGSL